MSDRITSVRNPRIRQAAKLRDRDERAAQQRCLVDGVREIARAMDAGVEIVDLFVCQPSLRDAGRRLVERAVAAGIDPCQVAPSAHAKLAFGGRDEGLVATVRPPQRALVELRLPPQPLVAVLVGIEKPGNIGAVVRSADAAGVAALIVADGGTDLFNPNIIRASLGTVFTLPVVAASSAQARAWLAQQHFRMFAARVGPGTSYTDVSLAGRTALILGNESAGLDATWSGDDVAAISLPMLGAADSLNVSVAAAVLFYEALRQRLHGSPPP
jgi:TrmH family RNA methyltransferase